MSIWIDQLSSWQRIVVYAAVAVAAHLAVKVLRALGERALAPPAAPGARIHELFARRRPKLASVTTLVVSGLTFTIYFAAVGLILEELGADLRTYLATATVLGLAIGFGMQGLVQDVVIGITLLFSDAFNVGDVVEISGQVGRVERIGLRFTELRNFHGQAVFVPNRNIALVARFRHGAVRTFIDVQLTDALDEERAMEVVEHVLGGLRAQHGTIVLRDPEILGVRDAGPGGWRFLRLKLRLWPGQTTLVDTIGRQRLLAAIRGVDPMFEDWMLTVVHRAD